MHNNHFPILLILFISISMSGFTQITDQKKKKEKNKIESHDQKGNTIIIRSDTIHKEATKISAEGGKNKVSTETSGSKVDVSQEGSGNTTRIDLEEGEKGTGKVVIRQQGSGNVSKVSVKGKGNKVNVKQSGGEDPPR